MSVKSIKASQIKEFEGAVCRACGQGRLERGLQHDAVSGNSSVLRCDRCCSVIEIYRDEAVTV